MKKISEMIKLAKKRHNALIKEMIKTLEKWDDIRLARSRRDVNEDEEDRMNKREAAIKIRRKKKKIQSGTRIGRRGESRSKTRGKGSG